MSRSRLPFSSAALVLGLVAASCSSSSSGTTPKGAAGDSGGGGDGAATPPPAPSCKASGAGLSDCGTGESCCASLPVPAGNFYRSYDDGVTTTGTSKAYPATIGAVSVDRYEVTVARFRAFVAAETAGWRPAAGSGKHSELNGGGGLNGGTEPGWDSSWNVNLESTSAGWSTALACDPPGQSFATWTESAGANDDHPINCVDWYEAYAFCIWDGGFLPTEAEWNYVAAGGSDQRAYPWSSPSTSTTLDCDHADYSACTPAGTTKVGAESPLGDGRWGHADLSGNVFEWTLDWDAQYSGSCDNCANLTPAEYRVIRGGAFEGAQVCLLNSLRETSVPQGPSSSIGFRCARP